MVPLNQLREVEGFYSWVLKIRRLKSFMRCFSMRLLYSFLLTLYIDTVNDLLHSSVIVPSSIPCHIAAAASTVSVYPKISHMGCGINVPNEMLQSLVAYYLKSEGIFSGGGLTCLASMVVAHHTKGVAVAKHAILEETKLGVEFIQLLGNF